MEDIFRFTTADELEMGLRLLLAGLYGGAIGYERRQADKPAGLRTLSLVAIGAALFTLISAFGFGVGDPARVAAQIVTGIGFLGAGAILRSGTTVHGLTTAASIWLAAAVGMAVGAGMYIVSLIATVLAIVILHFLPRER
jgi:putative Mg2+ transporter-C (MgtC) family protein